MSAINWNVPSDIKQWNQMFPLNGWDSGFLTWIDIDKAIELYPRKMIRYTKRSFFDIERRLKNNELLDPLFLKIDMDTCEVISHEGRHRLLVAKKLGIKTVPIMFEFWTEDPHDEWGLRKMIHDQKKAIQENPCFDTKNVKDFLSIPCHTEGGCHLKEVVATPKQRIIPEWEYREETRKDSLGFEIRELFETELEKCRSGETSVYNDFFCDDRLRNGNDVENSLRVVKKLETIG